MSDKKTKVLIVDDELPICELLQEDLTGRGYYCVTANNARQALAWLAEDSFDAILLDIRLPEMSGLDLLKQINSSYPSMAAIMLTAVKDVDTVVETMKAGALDYITKPFDLDHVERALQAALENKKRSNNNLTNGIPDTTTTEIEAIASGVEARQDMLDVHSEKVAQQTISIARQLGFPEEKIERWLAARSELQSKKVKQITDSMCMLERNPASQKIAP